MNTAPATLSQRERELTAIITAYNQVTEQLKQSHESLNNEVRKLRVELEDKKLELARRERLSALGGMATGVAHEIRNPLGSIQLYASMLDHDLNALPEAQKLVRKISAGVNALDHIVGGVLDFAGRREPRQQCVDMASIVSRACDAAAPNAAAKSVELLTDAAFGHYEVWADHIQIEQAVLNVVLNGIDATDAGGTIRIRSECDPPELARLIIEDGGSGIDEAIMDRIFNPFFTTKDAGTGLGLAIVHRIMESHGGRVTARNSGGGGACFVLELPTRAPGGEADADAAERNA
jgi:signal transduction histidine kinase